MNDLLRNGSGYYDPTAYKALTNIEGEQRKMEMELLKGDVVFAVNTQEGSGRKGCPMVLITNRIQTGGERQEYYIAVPLLRNEPDTVIEGKAEYHCDVMTRTPSVALCEKIMRVNTDRINDYVRSCTEEEMKAINTCLRNVFGLKTEENRHDELLETIDASEKECDEVRRTLNDKINKLKHEIAVLEVEKHDLKGIISKLENNAKETVIDVAETLREKKELQKENEDLKRQLEKEIDNNILERAFDSNEVQALKNEIIRYKKIVDKLIS